MDIDFIIEDIKRKLKLEREESYFLRDEFYGEREFENLKKYLLKNFSGQDLFQILGGKTNFNSRGRFYFLACAYKITLKFPDYNFCKERLLGSLSFLEGIRQITELKLKQKGYKILWDLLSHPRFSEKALKVCQILEETRIEEIISLCQSRFPKSDLIYVLLSALFQPQDFLFLDIETLGLFSGNVIFLIGLAKLGEEEVHLLQYLARFPEEESALLEEFRKALNKSRVLISYNGKSFDLPFLEHRAFFSNLSFEKPLLHLDLLHFARRSFKSVIERFRLANIEAELFKKERVLDIPSEYVPLLYREYLATGEQAYLLPILVHNRNDLITLIELLNLFYQRICS